MKISIQKKLAFSEISFERFTFECAVFRENADGSKDIKLPGIIFISITHLTS